MDMFQYDTLLVSHNLYQGRCLCKNTFIDFTSSFLQMQHCPEEYKSKSHDILEQDNFIHLGEKYL